MGFFTGSKAKNYQQSTLTPAQQPVLNQLTNAAQGKSTGGVFGDLGNYYKDLFDPNGESFQSFQAPEMRRFNEETIPGLSEQFAGMGSGGLSSSSFRNATVNAGKDLSERLGAIRANLRQQGAAGMANLGQQALGQYSENIHQPATGGFLDTIAPAIGTAAGGIFGGPLGAAAGNAAGNIFGGKSVSKGTDWTGGMPMTKPQNTAGKWNLPTFGGF